MRIVKTLPVNLNADGSMELAIPAMSNILRVHAVGWQVFVTAILDPSETNCQPYPIKAFKNGDRFPYDDPHRMRYLGSVRLPDDVEFHFFIDKVK